MTFHYGELPVPVFGLMLIPGRGFRAMPEVGRPLNGSPACGTPDSFEEGPRVEGSPVRKIGMRGSFDLEISPKAYNVWMSFLASVITCEQYGVGLLMGIDSCQPINEYSAAPRGQAVELHRFRWCHRTSNLVNAKPPHGRVRRVSLNAFLRAR